VTNVNGIEESCSGIVILLGVNSKRDLVAAASHRVRFPRPIDPAAAFPWLRIMPQQHFRTHALSMSYVPPKKRCATKSKSFRKAHDELEIKVAERTSGTAQR